MICQWKRTLVQSVYMHRMSFSDFLKIFSLLFVILQPYSKLSRSVLNFFILTYSAHFHLKCLRMLYFSKSNGIKFLEDKMWLILTFRAIFCYGKQRKVRHLSRNLINNDSIFNPFWIISLVFPMKFIQICSSFFFVGWANKR